MEIYQKRAQNDATALYISHTHAHAHIDNTKACHLCICIGVFSVRFNLNPRIKDKTKLRRAKMLFRISKKSVWNERAQLIDTLQTVVEIIDVDLYNFR